MLTGEKIHCIFSNYRAKTAPPNCISDGDSDKVVEKMGEVCGYVFEALGEKCLYLAADTIYCPEVEQTIKKHHPEAIILNCCEATTPMGRLIMNLSDIEKVCQAAPQTIVIASHLDSVNHALLT